MGDTLWYLGPMGTQFVVIGHERYLLNICDSWIHFFGNVLDLWFLIIDQISLVECWM